MAGPINPTQLTPPRVAFIDERTGAISREWYRFLLSLVTATQENQQDLTQSPDANSFAASLEQMIDDLSVQSETQPRAELGTMAALQQANVPWLTFNNAPSPVPTAVGSVYWDGGTTLGVQATANVLIRVGEAEYVYAKASSAITKGQLCYHTGAVGSSGVITVAPTPINLADPNQIVGVAAETIALNAFGLIQISGVLRGFNTTGSSVGETWADGDPLYYNPAFVGSLTKTKPVAPNQKTYIGEVTNAGSGGSGSIHIRIVPGSVLGGTDSNVQFGTLANKDMIQYDATLGYWKNVAFIPVTVANGGTGATTLTAGYVLKGNGTSAVTASVIYDSGVNVGIGTNAPAYKLDVATIAYTSNQNGGVRFGYSDEFGMRLKQYSDSGGVPSAAILGPKDGNGYLAFNMGSSDQERMRIDANGNVRVGSGALATTATDGFLYIPTCAGTPTGTPTTVTGLAPMVADSTNNKLYVYLGGAWQPMN